MSTPALNPLVTKIRAMHPGAYDDMDDATLTKRVLAKYPQYSDLAAPPAAGPHVDMQAHDLLGPVGKAEYPSVADSVGDLALGNLKSALQVSTPGIATSMAKKFAPDAAAKLPDVVTQNATPAEELPSQIMQTGLGVLAGGMENPKAGWTPVRGELAADIANPTRPGRLSRVVEVAKRRLGHIPGVQAVKDIDYIARSPKETTPAPAPPPAPAPETDGVPWGSGGQGPLELRGKAIPRGSTAESFVARRDAEASPIAETPAAQQSASPSPAAKAAPRPIPKGQWGKAMDEQLSKALGAQQLDPKVPLRSQVPGRMPTESAPALPEGHKAVDSSALRSYGYKPDVREFEARATSGDTIYVYGDVPPEVAEGFEKAESKGQAWAAIRRHPLVAKIVNGKRIAVKPAD